MTVRRPWLTVVLLAGSSACALSAQTPSVGQRDPRVTSVVYRDNDVVRVFATHGFSTMIVFDPDEAFETIALGDSDSWDVVPTERGNILFVKPKARNVTTNMNVVTTKRLYLLELNDQPPDAASQVFSIRFVYPDQQRDAALRLEAQARIAHPNIAGIDKANVNLAYSFSGNDRLKPSVVFDDGNKTFFRFPATVPAIFAVKADFSETLTNARREGDYLVVDGTATQYTLRDGSDWICIFNLRKPDFGAADADIMAPDREVKARLRRGSGN
ncbi:MAG: TrbG/VirB9 family P-type conjugative transfer protein [Alphaproteobacteria bacterium]|nr:TrbG/VirB9 family P-type conjugative transfer protein [Alphaproteobacteria bacterium]MBU1551255.1 TrbG/VirB9 family P-type conjugative transfer protein [Alphaproteobacteria bacterium]MBU2334810.1 TrbG/VirB9 family P-type conjugative transfer protein [Alphaproteobacteria bacterium]MBU2389313.1 TrbG/VirB9 family P-type conjugative transfer protein [Alphaproteobacteria bacterium]